jgi:polyketide biosynthesis enoyl-CoA hydratase PksI
MSDVILLDYYSDEIARVEFHDEKSHNTFSPEFIDGLYEVFDEIKQNNALKVVVLHGYDNYFCCGGTKQQLLSIAKGETKFNDLEFFRLMLECPIPCIAAMQGHALGGGLAFSCYADMMILAEEAYYASNFMHYGFTPGMGATYIGVKRFGEVMAHEMFYTGRNYQGRELKERGVQLNILPQDEVISAGLEAAELLAEKPRLSLTTLKQHLIKPILDHLPTVVSQEVAMHDITFTTEEVKARIESMFPDGGG